MDFYFKIKAIGELISWGLIVIGLLILAGAYLIEVIKEKRK